MKKILIILTTLATISLVALYIVIFQSNLVAQPTYAVSDEMKIIINGIDIKYNQHPIKENDVLYVRIDVLTKKLGFDIAWDKENETAVFYDGEKIRRFYNKSSELKINRGTLQRDDSLIVKDGQPLFSLEFINSFSKYECTFIEATNRLIIDQDGKVIRNAQILTDLRIRKTKSIWSEVKDIAKEDEMVYVYKEEGEWSLVRTSRGIFGYVMNDNVKFGDKIQYPVEQKDIVESPMEKINFTWEFVYKKTPPVDKLKAIKDLDVISPTWFNIENEKGDINDKASVEYVQWAHENGYKVWGLFSNKFDPDLTNIILNNSQLRERVINNIVDLAMKYELEGINLDFENIHLKDKDMLTQFVKELYPIAKESGLTTSIDITIKSLSPNWSLCYDRKSLGKFVDYVILMAYDEHWANGGVSGSVASLPWVEYGITSLLEDVPSEKIILGVPFYTRIWKEEYVDDELKVTSFAVTMNRASELLDKYKGTITLDKESKQYYGEYEIGEAVYRVWLEDVTSMKERLDLIKKYNLSGIASWRRGFEKEEIWDVISNNLR